VALWGVIGLVFLPLMVRAQNTTNEQVWLECMLNYAFAKSYNFEIEFVFMLQESKKAIGDSFLYHRQRLPVQIQALSPETKAFGPVGNGKLIDDVVMYGQRNRKICYNTN
jgi:hypothetical protein